VDSGDTEALKRLKQRLVSEYKYQSVLSLPVKNSVSAITHRDDEFKVDYFDRGIDKLTCARDKNKDVDIDPRTIGTATHLVFENLPIDKRPRICDAEKTLERLVNSGAVSPQIAAKIDINGILAFFDTEPAKLIFEEGTCVYREYPFTMALSPAECGYGNEDAKLGDDIIVQGIIDMLMVTPQGLVIVDFKTDNITASQTVARAQIYNKQVRLYSYAVSKILKKSVAAGWLYFLKPAVAYRC
jgi:ATP-dependent helicase/nuclease subunit A